MHHEPVIDHLEGYHAVWRSCPCIVTRISLQLTLTRIFVQLPQAAALANIQRAAQLVERVSFGLLRTVLGVHLRQKRCHITESEGITL